MDTRKEDGGKQMLSELALKDLQAFTDERMADLSAYRELIPTVGRLFELERHVRDISPGEESYTDTEEQNPAVIVQAEIQKRLISYGEELEQTYGLQDTEILHHLERCCEEVYQLGNVTGAEKEDLAETLDRHILEIPERLLQCVEVRPRRLSIAAILGNEVPYVEEWVEYHRLAGVDYFYIYDNQKAKELPDLLAPYVEEGIMSLFPMPGEGVMFTAYNDALNRFRRETDYMAFIDGDEFLVPLKEGKKIPDMIDAVLERFYREKFPWHNMEVGGIGVNWRVYGMNGHEKKPDGLVIENYLYRAEDTLPYSANIKTICNPRKAVSIRSPHYANYKPGCWCISQRGSMIPFSVFHDAHFEYLQINHYAFKSREEFYERKGKSWPDLKNGFFWQGSAEKYFEENLSIERESNAVYDPVLLPYVPLVKERIEARRNHQV